VASGLVLVIEDDEWVSRLLSNAIRDAGYDVVACATAKEGFEMACAEEPSCIICDVELPDGDGFWVARSIRMQPSRVAVTPFIFLSGLDDPESRMEGYQVGGDIYITKPFRIQEVVAQIEALVLMAERMRKQHDTSHGTLPAESSAPDIPIDIDVVLAETPPPDERSPRDRSREPSKDMAPTVTAIEGDLSQMSIATVLTVLEMERRTGIFEVVSKRRRAQLEIASGAVVQGMVGGTRVSALTTLRTMLGWTVGRFSFTPLPAREAPPNRKAIGAFLLEAVRLEDEAMRDELELPPSKRIPGGRLAAPALGGPASTADDLAPLSSKAASMAPPSVPSSTMPAMKSPHPSQPSIDRGGGSARGQSRAASEPPPPPRAEPDPLPMSQAQPTLELDMEAISVQPTGNAPLFPGLAHITGTHRVARPPATPRVPPPKQQPPPPPRGGSVNPPPPMPTTGSTSAGPNAAAPGHAPPPLPKTTPVRPPGAPPPPPPRPGRTETSGSVSPSTPPPPRPGPKPATPATPPPLPTAARPVPPPLPKPDNQPKKR
jgi:CheY-like chemotaxis protein